MFPASGPSRKRKGEPIGLGNREAVVRHPQAKAKEPFDLRQPVRLKLGVTVAPFATVRDLPDFGGL
jgi:hypothetical protein